MHREVLIQMNIEAEAARSATKPEPLHIQKIPKLKFKKISEVKNAKLNSQSARDDSERRIMLNVSLTEIDKIYQDLSIENTVDSILRRSNRDEQSKTVITKLDSNDFKKSVEEKSSVQFAEYADLITRAPLLSKAGNEILDVSKLKLGDKHVISLAQGFSKLTAETSSIKHIFLRDNRLTDEGRIFSSTYFYNLNQLL